MCLKYFLVFVLIAVALARRFKGDMCPFRPDYNNKDLNEENFLGRWFPHYFISNYNATVDDIDRFSCTIYNITKDKHGHYSMKPKRHNPKYKDDMKLHMYHDLVSLDSDKFGSFWFHEKQMGHTITPKTYVSIMQMNVTRRFMILLTCAEIGNTDLSVDGLILGRTPMFFPCDPSLNVEYEKQVITQLIKDVRYMIMDNNYKYNLIKYEKLSQNFDICQQFSNGIHFRSGFGVGSSILLLSTLLISRFQ